MSSFALRKFSLKGRHFLSSSVTAVPTFYRFKQFDTMALYIEKNPPTDIWADNKDPKYTDVEEVTGRWHYVERLFPKLRIPDPPSPDSSTGWKAPPSVIPDLPYFIRRSRNHMLPVYAHRVYKESVLVTRTRHVQGDIWLFEHHLKSYLQRKHKKMIESHVNEIACYVNVRGDYISDIKEWLYQQGF